MEAGRIPPVSGDPDTKPRIDIPEHLTREGVESLAREFTSVYHDLKDQTFATTTWLRVPLVKTATDILTFQQIIAETRPELIVETGVYVGGSALLFASVQEMMGIDGRVIAVDIDLSMVNDRVREHPRIELIEGSSTDPEIVERIRSAAGGKRVMVDLDADHRAHHVLEELHLYSPLVSPAAIWSSRTASSGVGRCARKRLRAPATPWMRGSPRSRRSSRTAGASASSSPRTPVDTCAGSATGPGPRRVASPRRTT